MCKIRSALVHCAGKGAVLAMSRQLAMEGAPHGIRVNTISPALVETAATRFPLENIPGFKEQVLEKLMIKRLGRPEDIGWLAIYLASDEATWVTASNVVKTDCQTEAGRMFAFSRDGVIPDAQGIQDITKTTAARLVLQLRSVARLKNPRPEKSPKTPGG
jgi:Enoyl-(Acyl carrier protein) reductase